VILDQKTRALTLLVALIIFSSSGLWAAEHLFHSEECKFKIDFLGAEPKLDIGQFTARSFTVKQSENFLMVNYRKFRRKRNPEADMKEKGLPLLKSLGLTDISSQKKVAIKGKAGQPTRMSTVVTYINILFAGVRSSSTGKIGTMM
jgi:hypothetical protein